MSAIITERHLPVGFKHRIVSLRGLVLCLRRRIAKPFGGDNLKQEPSLHRVSPTPAPHSTYRSFRDNRLEIELTPDLRKRDLGLNTCHATATKRRQRASVP